MSVSKITINVFNGSDVLVAKYILNDEIVDNDNIYVKEIFYNPDGSVFSTSKTSGWDVDSLIDQYMNPLPNVVGEHTTIQVDQLTPKDLAFFNELFSNSYEIADCVEFTVNPSVGLTNMPIIQESVTETCPICLENLYDKPASYISGNKIGTKYCNHKFHTDCIRKYCDQQDGNCQCPLCRNKIDTRDIRSLNNGGKRKHTKRRSTRKIRSRSHKRRKIHKQRKTHKRKRSHN